MIQRFFDEELGRPAAMALVFACSSIWGLLWIPLRWMDAIGVEGLWATLCFLFLPVPLMLVWKGRDLLRARRHRSAYLVAGGLIGAAFALYCTGLVVGSVMKTTLLFYLTPVWSTLMGMAVLGERPGWARWTAIALGIGGCALVLGLGQELGREHLTVDATDAFGFLSGVVWAMGSVAVRRHPETDVPLIALVQFVIGSAVTLAAVLVAGTPAPSLDTIVAVLPPAGVIALVFLPSMLVIFRINQYLSPGLIGLLMLSEAIFALLSAWWLLDERFAAVQWAGAAMIFATALLVAFSDDTGHASPRLPDDQDTDL